jgi:hypothetical protein
MVASQTRRQGWEVRASGCVAGTGRDLSLPCNETTGQPDPAGVPKLGSGRRRGVAQKINLAPIDIDEGIV